MAAPAIAANRFPVWAPEAQRVSVHLAPLGAAGEGARVLPLAAIGEGWWALPESESEQVSLETEYGFLLDDATTPLPDPRSLRQRKGVHGLTSLFDPSAFAWTDQSWTGRQLSGGVIYELHLGTFTPEGTLAAATERLAYLAELGVTHVELMPVNAFNGEWNWGYDGVLWHAVHEGYGGPEAYQQFVDAAHAHGLAVIQDVVFNHLGPSGNYLPNFGPYLSEHSNTWGANINLDGPGSEEVRAFIIDAALMFLGDYHVDGLRLDAVHALIDHSDLHILEELTIETERLSAHLGRPLTLIAESDLNDPKLITPREASGYGLHAQWSDDFHHAVHVALTGETTGYYADFEPLSALGKVLERGFFHDGTYSSFRERDHGAPIDLETSPTWRLVVANQNHDQIGNRAVGDRLSASLSTEQLQLAALLTLLGPFTPMLFQGEEWGASTPFQFFTSHPEPELAEATAKGRIAEFARMGWDESAVPDPQDPATFQRSKLDWNERSEGDHAVLLRTYQSLAALRAACPEFTDPSYSANLVTVDEEARTLELRRGRVRLLVNFGGSEWAVPALEIDASEQVEFETVSGLRGTAEPYGALLPAGAGVVLSHE
ncbi:malto-oligosyltrehalose trehalohydrolase [Humidisolicoccus flavus]|uniref:malto-oligosyltrehalose trehalohydrolase n=1 Tax=Humidisolicoccus flavus TaxID=3111414 RepID=UPI003254B435